jgi:hypothetical protein
MVTPWRSHDLPEAPRVGEVGRALVHHHGGAVGERAVDDVAVAGDPAHVGGAEVRVLLEVEDVLAVSVGAHHVAAGGVHHALGLPGRARGVEDEERVLGVDGRGGLALV